MFRAYVSVMLEDRSEAAASTKIKRFWSAFARYFCDERFSRRKSSRRNVKYTRVVPVFRYISKIIKIDLCRLLLPLDLMCFVLHSLVVAKGFNILWVSAQRKKGGLRKRLIVRYCVPWGERVLISGGNRIETCLVLTEKFWFFRVTVWHKSYIKYFKFFRHILLSLLLLCFIIFK